MDEKVVYWVSVVLSALALVLLITNVSLINNNRNLQAEVNRRQGMIAAGMNLNQLNQALVQALAQAAVKSDDKEARDLLAAQGITIKAKGDEASETEKKK